MEAIIEFNLIRNKSSFLKNIYDLEYDYEYEISRYILMFIFVMENNILKLLNF